MKRFLSLLMVLALVLLFAGTAGAAEKAAGKIKAVNPEKTQLTLTDKDGKEWTFELAPTAKVRLGDKEGKLADLKAGDQVEITYDKVGDKMTATAITKAGGG
jgi:Cu/Ag efflux protein CusF